MHKRALVTGGGTGIGRGIALALARRGFVLGLAGRRTDVLASTAAEITASGGEATALPVDLAEPQAGIELIERARFALDGRLDLLVNNAGVMLPGRFEHFSPQLLQQSLQVNLAAPMLLTQAALPDLKAARGSLILISSQVALLPLPYTAFYSASKAALRSFGAALRYELEESGIHLLLAYPPATDTAMTRSLTPPRLPVNSRSWRWGADPLRIGEQIVVAMERGQAERHWLDYQAPLIWLYKLWPGLVHRLLRSQLARFNLLMNAAPPEEETG
jgi:short-subunit dehydrogenase